MSVDERSGCMYSFEGTVTSIRTFCQTGSQITSEVLTIANQGLSKVKYGQIIEKNHLALIVVKSGNLHTVQV